MKTYIGGHITSEATLPLNILIFFIFSLLLPILAGTIANIFLPFIISNIIFEICQTPANFQSLAIHFYQLDIQHVIGVM